MEPLPFFASRLVHQKSTYDENKLLYFGYNQDSSCFAIGTDNGFVVYNTDPLCVRFRRDFNDGGIGIVEMLYRTNVLALVGGGTSPKFPKYKIMIWDDAFAECIAELVFKCDITGVRLRRDRIIAVLEKEVYEYNFSDLSLLNKYETISNPSGICCINGKGDPILVTLGEKPGEVRITTCTTNKSHLISAHDHPVSQMCLTEDGTRLATTSERGTKIRLFDTAKGIPIYEFTRGSYGATISSLSFNPHGTIIILTSDTGTIHLFSCEVPESQPNAGFGITAWVSPTYWRGSNKSISQFSIPQETDAKGTIVSSVDSKVSSVIVLGASGIYYKYLYTPGQVQWTQSMIQHFFVNGIPL